MARAVSSTSPQTASHRSFRSCPRHSTGAIVGTLIVMSQVEIPAIKALYDSARAPSPLDIFQAGDRYMRIFRSMSVMLLATQLFLGGWSGLGWAQERTIDRHIALYQQLLR